MQMIVPLEVRSEHRVVVRLAGLAYSWLAPKMMDTDRIDSLIIGWHAND